MGAQNSKYDRSKRIDELREKRFKIMDDSFKMDDFSEKFKEWEKADKIDDKIKRLEEMDKIEKNFDKNINLNEYRNPDGTFNVYKCERSLDVKGGKASNSIIKALHHEGVAIGNGKKMFFTDFGTKKEFLDVRFWDSEEKKDKWKKIEKVGTSNATNDDIKKIFFGEKSEQWNSHDDYKPFAHNCKHYVKEKIWELTY